MAEIAIMKVIKPPIKIPDNDIIKIFLAGSIEMGTAENWQEKVEKTLSEEYCIILNPRRDDWDSTWEQSIHNPRFRQQVEWELDALEKAYVIAVYFDPNTKSPISLLEFGLYALGDENGENKLVVCCPDGFWRQGNVEIVCMKYNIPFYRDFEKFVKYIRMCIKRY